MKTKCFFFLVFFCIGTSLSFSREKLSETSDSLAYNYSDWTEFYTDLIEASNKESYKYAYLRNLITDEEKKYQNALKDNSWRLVSYKLLQERDMIYAFFAVSPNNHSTVLILSNNQVASSRYKIADKYSMWSESSASSSVASSSVTKTKDSSKKTASEKKQDNENERVFLERIISTFDEQLCFFDEEVPLKLQDFNKSKTSQKTL